MSKTISSWLCTVFSFIAFLFLTWKDVQAQNPVKQLNDARRHSEAGRFEEAERIASGILKKDSSFQGAYLLLADLYLKIDSARLEAGILKALNNQSPQQNPLFFYRIGKALYKSSQFGEASEWFRKYLAGSKPGNSRFDEVKKLAGNCLFAAEAILDPVEFNPERLGNTVNTADDEYWPVILVDRTKLVFTRLIKTGVVNRLPQEDFFQSESDSSGWKKAEAMAQINTPSNEGAQSISADGQWLYFTACNRSNGKGSCDLFFSRYDGKNWSAPEPVRGLVNSGGWEGQPSLSSEGRYLYFSSDRSGGKGGKDIWRSCTGKFSEDGIPVWDAPVNLGDSVNTAGEEISPFIHPGGADLYFSSDSWPGMGGLDLFHVKMKAGPGWTTPRNLGYPLNTAKNEQGLVIDATGETAYFASGRDKKTGMDIYSFKVDKRYRPDPVTYLSANVTDSWNGNPVQAEVMLQNLDSRKTEIFNAGPEGHVFVCLPVGNDYGVQVSKEGYFFYSCNFPLKEVRSMVDPYLLEIKLSPLKTGEKMNLYNLFFNTNSADLLPESIPELMQLYRLLDENPLLRIEIQGHTDTVGARGYNKVLSEKRAQSVMAYLISMGIPADRLSTQGYGFDHPLDTNETEEGRRRNRRTTILIK